MTSENILPSLCRIFAGVTRTALGKTILAAVAATACSKPIPELPPTGTYSTVHCGARRSECLRKAERECRGYGFDAVGSELGEASASLYFRCRPFVGRPKTSEGEGRTEKLPPLPRIVESPPVAQSPPSRASMPSPISHYEECMRLQAWAERMREPDWPNVWNSWTLQKQQLFLERYEFLGRACKTRLDGHGPPLQPPRRQEPEPPRRQVAPPSRRFHSSLPSDRPLLLYGGDGQGEFLGCLNCSDLDPKSVHNEIGEFGSTVSRNSIWNSISDYGSSIGQYSACNSIASKPPVIVDQQGNFYGRLTVNSLADQVQDSAVVDWLEQVVCGE